MLACCFKHPHTINKLLTNILHVFISPIKQDFIVTSNNLNIKHWKSNKVIKHLIVLCGIKKTDSYDDPCIKHKSYQDETQSTYIRSEQKAKYLRQAEARPSIKFQAPGEHIWFHKNPLSAGGHCGRNSYRMTIPNTFINPF